MHTGTTPEDGTDNGEDGTDNGEDGADNGEDGTDNGEDGADNGEDGTDNGEDGANNGKGEQFSTCIYLYTAMSDHMCTQPLFQIERMEQIKAAMLVA